MIRWIPDIDHRTRERTEVGCSRCQTWRAAKEDRWAFAEWNLCACREWARTGQLHPHVAPYELEVDLAEHERAEAVARARIAAYLEENVASRSQWKPGDRFESRRRPRGTWSVRRVEGVYGMNTGPFCIIHAVEVLPSGLLGDNRCEFWDFQISATRLLPYWRPSNWAQVVEGDECLLGER